MYRKENGVEIQLTVQEEAAVNARVAAEQAAQPLIEWENKMIETDIQMPRWGEDILDGMPDKSGVAQITLDKLQAKKDLRATKP